MVKFDPKVHHRRSVRLKEYDYSQPGAYFVTIVAYQRECLFGKILSAESRLNKIGKIVESEWLELPKRLSYLTLGASTVMPNHFHGILFIHENVGASRQYQAVMMPGTDPLQVNTAASMDGSPLRGGQRVGATHSSQTGYKPGTDPLQAIVKFSIDGSPLRHGPAPASLGAIIAQFKSRVTKRIWKIPELKGRSIWQRNYHEHIIRNEKDLKSKTEYIQANPLLWSQDEENPFKEHS